MRGVQSPILLWVPQRDQLMPPDPCEDKASSLAGLSLLKPFPVQGGEQQLKYQKVL